MLPLKTRLRAYTAVVLLAAAIYYYQYHFFPIILPQRHASKKSHLGILCLLALLSQETTKTSNPAVAFPSAPPTQWLE